MLKALLIITALTSFTGSLAQTAESDIRWHEISLISDNDNYALGYSDHYYTNGFTFCYSFINKQGTQMASRNTQKVIQSVAFGHKIYTPSDIQWKSYYLFDRPYAGWLFLNSSFTYMLQNEAVVDFNLELGASGSYSLAEPIQKWWHHVVHYDQPEGWKYQIANSLGLNFTTKVMKGWPITRFLDLISTSDLQFGTHFQNGSQDVSLRAGAINTLSYSAYTNSKLGLKPGNMFPKSSEHFLVAGLKFTSVLQNALIEGSQWPKQSPHQENIHPNYTTYHLGWVSSNQGCTIKVTWYYLTPEIIGGTDHNFVRLFLSFRFN